MLFWTRVTLDNGFLTDYARKNIESLIRGIGIDHVWVRPPSDVLKTLYANNLKSEAWPCSACFHMMEASAWRLAHDMKIPFIISGRTPEQILRKPDMETLETISSLIEPVDPGSGSNMFSAKNFLARVRAVQEWLLPEPKLRQSAEDTLYLRDDIDLSDDFETEFIPFFLFEEHNETKIIEELTRETAWCGPERIEPLSHSDCSAHDAATYLFRRAHGSTIYEDEVRSLLRLKKIQDSDAIRLLRKNQGTSGEFSLPSLQELSRVSGMGIVSLMILPGVIKIRRLLKKYTFPS